MIIFPKFASGRINLQNIIITTTENFNFYSPTEFVFGRESEKKCGKYVRNIQLFKRNV